MTARTQIIYNRQPPDQTKDLAYLSIDAMRPRRLSEVLNKLLE